MWREGRHGTSPPHFPHTRASGAQALAAATQAAFGVVAQHVAFLLHLTVVQLVHTASLACGAAYRLSLTPTTPSFCDFLVSSLAPLIVVLFSLVEQSWRDAGSPDDAWREHLARGRRLTSLHTHTHFTGTLPPALPPPFLPRHLFEFYALCLFLRACTPGLTYPTITVKLDNYG